MSWMFKVHLVWHLKYWVKRLWRARFIHLNDLKSCWHCEYDTVYAVQLFFEWLWPFASDLIPAGVLGKHGMLQAGTLLSTSGGARWKGNSRRHAFLHYRTRQVAFLTQESLRTQTDRRASLQLFNFTRRSGTANHTQRLWFCFVFFLKPRFLQTSQLIFNRHV